MFWIRENDINENNVAKEGLNLKWRRQKMKSTYFASNQWLAKNRLFSLQYDIENFIFADSYHENFIFTSEYVFAERCCFLHFRLKESSENMIFPRMETYEN